MFEQSILVNASKAKRVWAASLGVTGQALLVGAMILAPMLWPDAMPRAAFTMLVPHAPPGRHRDKDARPHPATRVVRRYVSQETVQLPRYMPPVALILSDPAPAASAGPAGACNYCVDGGGAGDGGALVSDFLRDTVLVQRPAEAARPVEKPKPEPVIERHKVGGVVHEPVLLRRIEPRYPELARRAGIGGVVRLWGVIGIDGRIRELTVKSGNPLLAPAAVDAVRQWLYQPTLLNGDPIELETEIVVTFTLNR